jgi:uncharacterized protein involved in outer membrane biogenesis
MQGKTVRFVAFMATVLVLGSLGLVLLSTSLQEVTFAVNDKRAQANALADQVADLEAQLTAAGSVSGLAAKAQDLGMKPNTHTALIKLPKGKIVGQAVPVTGGEVPAASYRTLAERQRMRAIIEEQARIKADRKRQAEAKAKKEAAEKAEAKAKAEAKKKAEKAKAAGQ